MTKRAYPFLDHSPLQLKMHIGPWKLNGICGDQFKQEIFEKTKQLLFSGAQTYMDHMWNGSTPVVSSAAPNFQEHTLEKPSSMELCGEHGLLQGQTLIGQNGRLVKCSKDNGNNFLPTSVSPACYSCVKSVGDKKACTQCERLICINCRLHCSCCQAPTCSLCSVVYDNDETVFCYSCSLFEVSR